MASERQLVFDRRQRAAVQVAGLSARTSPMVGIAVIVGLIGASWAVAFALGGAGPVPPHWFYIPIMFAALRFGWQGTLAASVVSGLMAGPLLPLEVNTGVPQAFRDLCLERLVALRGLGVSLAIDDFGTGQSSLSYVHLFPVQTIKLDRSFIAQITHSERGQVFVGTIILLAHTLELVAVAEGIEAADQLELLKAMRCDRGQGFHLGVPSMPDDITEALDEHRGKRVRGSRATNAQSPVR